MYDLLIFIGNPSVLQLKFTEARVDVGAVTAQVFNEYVGYEQLLFLSLVQQVSEKKKNWHHKKTVFFFFVVPIIFFACLTD